MITCCLHHCHATINTTPSLHSCMHTKQCWIHKQCHFSKGFTHSYYYHHWGCADSASLPSIMHIQSTASRRTGRGDACVSLGCAVALRTCSERWKEGTPAANRNAQCRTSAESVQCMVWSSSVPCNAAPAARQAIASLCRIAGCS